MTGPTPQPSMSGVLLLSDQGTVLGRSGPESLVGRPPQNGSVTANLSSIYRTESDDSLATVLTEFLGARSPTDPRSVRVWPKDGESPHPLRLTLHRLAPHVVAATVDVETEAPAESASASDVLDRVWARLSDAMAVVTSLDDPEGPRIAAANPAFCGLFGVRTEELRGRSLAGLLNRVGDPTFLSRIKHRVVGAGETVSDVAAVRRSSRGATLIEWEIAPIHASDGSVQHLVAVLRDVTRPSRTSQHRGLDVDPLTGLPSQAHFMNCLERSVERVAQAPAYAVAVLGFEVDDLRAVERRLGAVVSNTVVEALAWRIKQRLRPGDLIARTGERSLTVLLDYFAPWGAVEEVLDRIAEATREPYTIGGEKIVLPVVSAASAVWSRDRLPAGAQEVMDEVARAVTRAKGEQLNAQPRNRQPGSVGARQPSGIAQAVRGGELDLTYLPLVDVFTGRPEGLEALVRWRHPERGTLSGKEFLEEAESAGLILPIGRWVLWHACQQVKRWEDTLGPQAVLPVHINVSISEFWNRELLPHLRRVTAEVGVDPSKIRLEVPEAAIARRVSSACRILADLGEAGFETWLDKFGEGGVGLQDLLRLPVRHAKVAPGLAWTTNGGKVAVAAPLLRSLLGVAHDLGWRVTVLGVETASQRALLGDAGCDLAEGFHFSEPLDAAGASNLPRQWM